MAQSFSLHQMTKPNTSSNQEKIVPQDNQYYLSNHCANAMDFERTTKQRKATTAKEVSSREKPGPPPWTIILHTPLFLLAAASAKLPRRKKASNVDNVPFPQEEDDYGNGNGSRSLVAVDVVLVVVYTVNGLSWPLSHTILERQ